MATADTACSPGTSTGSVLGRRHRPQFLQRACFSPIERTRVGDVVGTWLCWGRRLPGPELATILLVRCCDGDSGVRHSVIRP